MLTMHIKRVILRITKETNNQTLINHMTKRIIVSASITGLKQEDQE